VTAETSLPAVSLFSNCGAGDVGFRRAGFSFEVLAELDERRLSIAALNHPGAATVPGDLRETWREVLRQYRARRGDESPALLAACPPCQGMSSARSGRGRDDDPDAGSRDERNLLVSVIAAATNALKPRVVVVENVPAFLTRAVRHPKTGAPISAAALLARRLNRHYVCSALVADLADFGIPQTRKRSFMCFLRRDLAADRDIDALGRAPFPRPTHAREAGKQHRSIRSALRDLDAESLDAASASTAGSGMHVVPVWAGQRYAMVASIPPRSGAGAWSNEKCAECDEVAEPTATQCRACAAPLPRPVVQSHDGTWRFVKGFRASSYSRMHPDRPAATITTASGHVGSDHTIHPEENRVLSPWECQHLQTIPPDFEWGDALTNWGTTNVRAMIGEAVPPQFTEMHGDVLVGLLTGEACRAAISSSDLRITRAHDRLMRAERIARGLAS
jgi:DNA (cytosine-5)-methyltransferase 1